MPVGPKAPCQLMLPHLLLALGPGHLLVPVTRLLVAPLLQQQCPKAVLRPHGSENVLLLPLSVTDSFPSGHFRLGIISLCVWRARLHCSLDSRAEAERSGSI